LRASLSRPFVLLLALSAAAPGGEFPRKLEAFRGSIPVIDGKISPGEWDDAVGFTGGDRLGAPVSPTTDPLDLALHGYVKHDGHRLYFAFDITDDVLYSIETPRWLPDDEFARPRIEPSRLSVVRRRDGAPHQRGQPLDGQPESRRQQLLMADGVPPDQIS